MRAMTTVRDRPNNEEKAMSYKNVKEWTDILETLWGAITSYTLN